LAGDSPRAALDAFVERTRRSIACVGEAHVAGDGHDPNRIHAIGMKPYRPDLRDRLQLYARESGRPDLLLDIAHEYSIVEVPEHVEHGAFWVQTTSYRYHIYDLDGEELLLYHWHPGGVSDIEFPHVHVACAPRIMLPRPRTDERRPVDIGKLHLPTNQVLLEDVIELLIRDLGVEPRPAFRIGDAWRTVLRDNREAPRQTLFPTYPTVDDVRAS
jgi:hypothetical protein